ncbi:MAG: hypothetical protein K2X03_12575 [Bryobacteraceae bacterium]|nr:hypothetical protein [Bryobacteraceae bacterium]
MAPTLDLDSYPTLEALALELTPHLVRYNDQFSYVFTGVTLHEEDLKDFLEEPITALPPKALELLGPVELFFVPYLENIGPASNGVNAVLKVATKRPPDGSYGFAAGYARGAGHALFLAAQESNLNDYHYYFFRSIAGMVSERLTPANQDTYVNLLTDEIKAQVHGEMDETSWRMKQDYLETNSVRKKPGKAFFEYARQSMIDTMTLYLHGICCDIDVEPGPRQLASRSIRRRLEFLQDLIPPPEGRRALPAPARKP